MERNIDHKSVMSIHEFFMNRYEPTNIVDQAIDDMEVIVYASTEGGNGMDQLFTADLLFNGAVAI